MINRQDQTLEKGSRPDGSQVSNVDLEQGGQGRDE